MHVAPVAVGLHLLDVFYHALPEELRGECFVLRGMNTRARNEKTQRMIAAGGSVDELLAGWEEEVRAFARQRDPYLLYE